VSREGLRPPQPSPLAQHFLSMPQQAGGFTIYSVCLAVPPFPRAILMSPSSPNRPLPERRLVPIFASALFTPRPTKRGGKSSKPGSYACTSSALKATRPPGCCWRGQLESKAGCPRSPHSSFGRIAGNRNVICLVPPWRKRRGEACWRVYRVGLICSAASYREARQDIQTAVSPRPRKGLQKNTSSSCSPLMCTQMDIHSELLHRC